MLSSISLSSTFFQYTTKHIGVGAKKLQSGSPSTPGWVDKGLRLVKAVDSEEAEGFAPHVKGTNTPRYFAFKVNSQGVNPKLRGKIHGILVLAIVRPEGLTRHLGMRQAFQPVTVKLT